MSTSGSSSGLHEWALKTFLATYVAFVYILRCMKCIRGAVISISGIRERPFSPSRERKTLSRDRENGFKAISGILITFKNLILKNVKWFYLIPLSTHFWLDICNWYGLMTWDWWMIFICMMMKIWTFEYVSILYLYTIIILSFNECSIACIGRLPPSIASSEQSNRPSNKALSTVCFDVIAGPISLHAVEALPPPPIFRPPRAREKSAWIRIRKMDLN